MSALAKDALFPLPLTSFEKYMLADDRPDYPMTFSLHLDFSGEFRRPHFEASLEDALSRHPLLCAVVRDLPKTGRVWMPAEGAMPPIDWNVPTIPLTCPRGEAIDLQRETGLRIWVRQGSGAARMTVQFHHACCDGLHAFRFVGDTLAAYAARISPGASRTPLPAFDPASLLRRGQHVRKLFQSKGRLWGTWITVRETIRWLICQPAPLSASVSGVEGPGDNQSDDEGAVATSPLPFPRICSHTLDVSQTQRFRAAAVKRGVTVNDLLVCDMFRTLQQWNAQHSRKNADRHLRINMPVLMQQRPEGHVSAANTLSYTFLTRRASECGDRGRLLESIRGQTDLIKRYDMGTLFLDGLATVQRIPGLLPLLLGGRRCLATVVLSNVGNPIRQFPRGLLGESGKAVAGDMTLEGVAGSPPIRRQTRAAFGIIHYAGMLTISALCDPRHFTPHDARQLLAMYTAQIEATAGKP